MHLQSIFESDKIYDRPFIDLMETFLGSFEGFYTGLFGIFEKSEPEIFFNLLEVEETQLCRYFNLQLEKKVRAIMERLREKFLRYRLARAAGDVEAKLKEIPCDRRLTN